MWNLIYSNPICFKKKIAQEQLMHLNNIQNSKPLVNNSQPWRPGHSISKLVNKYTNTNDQEIQDKNSKLLRKMMEIQQRNNSLKQPPTHGSLEVLRRREQFKISSENQTILKRLQSASSAYSRKTWINDIERVKKYRENLQRRTRTNDDFNLLAAQEQVKRNLTSQSSFRKLKTSQGPRTQTYESLI
ncbi:unnamed protein product [Paramecium pentaurelia]|uniref:Uncharacterized protein n=1 Tax=Paramecium pentaurelia TaxID=43138 RepID=A0A8S1TJZ6_9CILI|nr:unnamed protein product [Paramecium pentaurelia]